MAFALAVLIGASCGPLPKRVAAPTPAPSPTPRDLAASVFAPPEAPPATPRPTSAPPPVPLTRVSVDRGSRLFLLRGCYLCHGEDAEGVVGPRLAGTSLPFDAVLIQVRFPRTGRMPNFPPDRLPDESVADIYNFVRSLGSP